MNEGGEFDFLEARYPSPTQSWCMAPAPVRKELHVVLALKQLPGALCVCPGQHWKEPYLPSNSQNLGFEVKCLPDPLPSVSQCPGTETGPVFPGCQEGTSAQAALGSSRLGSGATGVGGLTSLASCPP